MKMDLNMKTLKQLVSDVGPEAFDTLTHALKREIEIAKLNFSKYNQLADWHMLEVDAHAMKSAARSFGADDLAEKCLEIEVCGKEKGPPEKVERLLQDFTELADLAMDAITRLKI